MRVEVADDGRGGADPARGSGLRGLVDRVEALSGRLASRARPARGTRVRAEIPLSSRAARTARGCWPRGTPGAPCLRGRPLRVSGQLMTDPRGHVMTFQYNTCAACGAPMAESLVRLGSIRCHDCRETAAPMGGRSVEAHAVGTLVAHTEREDSLNATQTDTAREFAHRAGDGLDVTLVWYPDSEPVAVRVTDARTGESLSPRPRASPRSTPSSTPSPTSPTPTRLLRAAPRPSRADLPSRPGRGLAS